MKFRCTGLILGSAFALVSQTTTAQNLINNSVDTFNDSKATTYMASSDISGDNRLTANRVAENSFKVVKESFSARSLYMSSEQYVFDNLGSLKNFFAVADIYFDLDQASIRPDALPVLDQLVNLMMENPNISLATTAYADTRFSAYNAKLGLKRAEAANAYLISKGIGADRLQIEKHGRPQMANPCNNDPSCSLAVQQLNRKTEFNVIYNGVNLGQIN